MVVSKGNMVAKATPPAKKTGPTVLAPSDPFVITRKNQQLVPVVVGLVRAFHGDADVLGLFL